MTNTECKICRSRSLTSYYPGDYRLLKCQDCGIIFLASEMAMKDTEDYYSKRFINHKYTSESTKLYLRKNSREVLNIIKKFRPNGNLLDIGTNIGIFVEEANKQGYVAVGIEPSKTLSAEAARLGIPVIESTIEKFDPKNTFDVITMLHVLEHLQDPLEVLKKIRSLQSDDGLLVLEVPNIESYLGEKDGIFWKFIALEHLFYFSERNISGILKRAGYKVLVIKKRNFELNRLNIRKLIRYFIGKKLTRDRFFNKKESLAAGLLNECLLKSVVRKFLIFFIHILGREDRILIIAQKC